MTNTVLVKGNIIGMAGHHLARNYVCLVTPSYQDNAVKVIEGDLILDEHTQTLPYCVYAATGGISTLGADILTVLPQPNSIHSLYQEEMNQMQELLGIPLLQNLQPIQNRLLYIGIIGNLELFLTEILAILVLGIKDYNDAFLKKSQVKIPLSRLEEAAFDIQKTIYNVIHQYNAHDLRTMKRLYKDVLNVDFPDYSRLAKMIIRRHDMVHRNGYMVGNKALYYDQITKETVISLIDTCNEFVGQLWSALQPSLLKWEEF